MKKLLFFTLSILTFFSQSAVLKSIQKGSATVLNASSSTSVTITAVDLSKSFLIFSQSGNSDRPTHFQVAGYLSNSTTIVFERSNTSAAMNIEYEVFEFTSGVSVERGVTSDFVGAGPYQRDITIASVNVSESFATLTMGKNGVTYGNDDGFTAEITSSTNLRIKSNGSGATANDLHWQVIQWTGSSVQQVKHTLPENSDSTGFTLATSVNKNKTMVIGNHLISSNLTIADGASTELLDDNTVIFTRVGLTGNLEFLVYVVEFTDDTDVIHGAVRMLASETTASTKVCDFFSTTTSGIIMPSNLNRFGTNCHSTNDQIGLGWGRATLTDTDEITITRKNNGDNARFQFQILEFTSATPTGCVEPFIGANTPRTSKGNNLCSTDLEVLPVELTNFSAESSNGITELNWTTASELNNDYFILESSNDFINFEELILIEGNGTTTNSNTYIYKDTRRLNSNRYYRLKQVDFDGTTSYSPIISLFSGSDFEFNLLTQRLTKGQPVIINVSNSENKEAKISLFDISGKEINNIKVPLNETTTFIEFPINENITPGIYVIKAQSGNNLFTKKVTIQ